MIRASLPRTMFTNVRKEEPPPKLLFFLSLLAFQEAIWNSCLQTRGSSLSLLRGGVTSNASVAQCVISWDEPPSEDCLDQVGMWTCLWGSFPKWFSWSRKTHPECGQHHFKGRAPNCVSDRSEWVTAWSFLLLTEVTSYCRALSWLPAVLRLQLWDTQPCLP